MSTIRTLQIDRRSATPIYAQIAEQLRQQIATGQLQAGQSLPTNEQFGAQLNVARKTVQQAIATLAREQYVERRRGKGTFVKGAPLRGVVGIVTSFDVIGTKAPPYYQGMAQRFHDRLASEGHSHRFYLMTGDADGANAAGSDLMSDLDRRALSGILMLNYKPYMSDALDLAHRTHVPIVALASTYPGPISIRPDGHAFLRMAAEHLAQQGRRRIGVIYIEYDNTQVPPAPQLLELIEAAGCQSDPEWLIGDAINEHASYQAVARLPLEELDGLLIADDVPALGVDRFLCEAGIHVPDQLLVTTWWNQGLGLNLSLPFVRIGWDVDDIAADAMNMLQHAMAGHRLTEPRRAVPPRVLQFDCPAAAESE